MDRLIHALRFNSRRGSRRNISAHYDLGNAFYETWLGESWFYSSGIYESESATLEDAQRVKCAHIVEALKLDGSQSLLEIGCGWGGFALAAAPHTSRIRAITISEEQLAHARKVVQARGLADRVNVVFEDYRDTQGQFDRLVSIEMIEAVGESNWGRYFGALSDRLKPGGIGVLQAITIAPAYFDTYRRTPDFIQRYIFPGGMLPTVAKMEERANAAGLRFETVETFGQSYARTLAAWRTQFLDAWPRIAAQGFDERFRRMWLYYLGYCEAGFSRGTIDVGLYRVIKPA
jgi:cyclopropane-fatty-acyl-phospholipid synthase